MFRCFVPVAVVLLTACANAPAPQGAAAGCRFSPNPRALQMDCQERQTVQNAVATDGLCPGSLNPKLHGSMFCARAGK